ncbi:MAG TPA: GNAT family N-acetyltransferase [Anaerolineae bacterium]
MKTDLDLAPLSSQQCQVLADALEDTPETVISISQLRRGLARAFVIGDPADFQAAVVEDLGSPGEPMAFGSDASLLADLLPAIPGWFCVNVSPAVAPDLGPLLAERMGYPIRYYGDIYHILTQPAPDLVHTEVRSLTLADLPLLEAAPAEIRGLDLHRLLTQMAAAGAVVDSQIVAIAINYARSARYADIGVQTLPQWRGRGFAPAAAAIVAREAQASGRIPVWSCGENNRASLRVAQKLGFQEVSRRTYIILNKASEARGE